MGALNGVNILWQLELGNGSVESNFVISRFDDANIRLDAPLSIDRATGVCTFSEPPVWPGNPLTATKSSVTGALDKIAALTGLYYDAGDGRQHIGLDPDEVKAVLPELVIETLGGWDDEMQEAEPPVVGIAYGNLVPVLINAIKELKAEVDALKTATRH